ncbi:MAG: TetR/AcrR family transcriptional regulator [Candidatus Dormibacteraeota bacterium]|uniref:TetR/AcrR family transcriptional regulator n=1 Tax=Candidatus Dormiibacter inghamiae TaxID=3127013 RepID=A0A934N610_9BACT|nr:TetR/AcrR family transcriptional regulator [Candidatus Dormibacteraeota bacterium]MBJ7606968.1 TetR/AcrR family transcriptional regulator [Candidatus Dormibacteraeota bacterium]
MKGPWRYEGYAATSMGMIATAAGVSSDTIYLAYGGKRGVIEAVIHSAMYQDAATDPHWSTAIERLPSGGDRMRAWVAHTCNHLADTSPVHEIIRVAAGTEPFVAQLRARLLEERLSLQRHRARQILLGVLRSGVTLDDAADRYSALLSPELHHLLTIECGWPLERYREWVTKLLIADLLTVDAQ